MTRHREKLHCAERLLGFCGNEPVTPKVQPKAKLPMQPENRKEAPIHDRLQKALFGVTPEEGEPFLAGFVCDWGNQKENTLLQIMNRRSNPLSTDCNNGLTFH